MVRPGPRRDPKSPVGIGSLASVSETPEEPVDGEPGSGAGNGDPDDPHSPQRGWIDPADRIWRHPSELAPGGASPVLFNAPAHRPSRAAIMVIVGVAAVMAAVAFILILLSPASSRPQAGSTRDTVESASITTLAGPANAVPAAADAAGRAMVQLRAATSHGTVTLVGVAVAEGGLVVTTADMLGDGQSLDLVGPGGGLAPASVVAIDRQSDIALVNVPEDVPVAPFADDASLAPGTADLTLSLVPAGGDTLALHCTPGSVAAVGAAIAGGPAGGMPGITSTPASATTPAGATVSGGEPLLNTAGKVMGILYPGKTPSSPATFLPTQLVVGVADDLRSSNRVVHGWLGVGGGDMATGGGAVVRTVNASGPAANALRVGEVIVAVNAQPVRTMAELRARLYVLAPGTTVAVSVQDGGAARVVDVTLGGSS
jgi:S1-C subfamily serine protease